MKWVLFGLVFLLCELSIQGDLAFSKSREQVGEEEIKMTELDSTNLAKKHLSFGYRYLKSNQYEDAETQLTKSWKYNPKRATTARYLGRLYDELEKYEDAISWFNRSLKLDSQSKHARSAYHSLANIYVLQENRKEAIQALHSLLDFDPSQEKEIQYLHRLVSLYVEEEEYKSALNLARRWGKLEPNNPDVQDTIAKLALTTGEEDEALIQMEKVIEMNPDDFGTLEKLAEIYNGKGNLQKAFDAYQKLHSKNSQNFLYCDNLLQLGNSLGKSRHFRIRLLKKMYKLQPKNLSVIERLADLTGSLSLINQGLKLDLKNGKLNYMKGDHYYKQWKKTTIKEDSIRSIRWFKKAKVDPQWSGNAQRMIDEIDPPLTEEEKMRRKFFEKKVEKEEVDTRGKK